MNSLKNLGVNKMWPFNRPSLRSVRFEPKPDITTYELLHVPGVVHMDNPIGKVWPRDDYYEGLPDTVKRHFVELDWHMEQTVI